jgi:hypothetical protein
LPEADGVAAGQLVAALDAGFPVTVDTTGADLTIVLLDDYLDPQPILLEVERRAPNTFR